MHLQIRLQEAIHPIVVLKNQVMTCFLQKAQIRKAKNPNTYGHYSFFSSEQKRARKDISSGLTCAVRMYTAQYTAQLFRYYNGMYPSSIYSGSISHILEHEFYSLGRLGSKGNYAKVS